MPPVTTEPIPRSRASSVLIATAFFTGLLAIGISIYAFKSEIESTISPVELPDAVIVLNAGTLPAAITLIDGERATLLEVPETGEFLKIVDADFLGTSTAYYLIADTLYTSSNLYRQDLGAPGRPITQITNSDTYKSNLSVATQGNLITYEARTGESSTEVVLYSLITKEEEVLSEGTRPVIAPDGSHVVFELNGQIQLIDRTFDKEVALMPVPAGSLLSIDVEGSKIAVYKSDTKKIEEYSFDRTTDGVSSVASYPVSFTPAALGYLDGNLLYASVVTPDTQTLMVNAAGVPWTREITLPKGNRLEGLTQYGLSTVTK